MRAGQDPARFPDYSLREIAVIIQAATDRDADLAHQQAVFNSFAWHKPQDMPDPREKRGHDTSGPKSARAAEADAAYVRGFFKAMARQGS